MPKDPKVVHRVNRNSLLEVIAAAETHEEVAYLFPVLSRYEHSIYYTGPKYDTTEQREEVAKLASLIDELAL